jgi:hypothetical protein
LSLKHVWFIAGPLARKHAIEVLLHAQRWILQRLRYTSEHHITEHMASPSRVYSFLAAVNTMIF